MNLSTKQASKMIFLFCMAYMVSYITRINYGAVISEMEKSMQISKQTLSLALTGSFITYGAGQIISGIAGDKLPPKTLVLCGLGVTSAMNILIPICQTPTQMLIVWSINGLSQAFMWPPIVKLMVSLFSPEVYKRASVTVSCGSSIGTIIIYILAPVLISTAGWRAVFFTCGGCGIIMMLMWQRFCVNITPCSVTKDACVSGARASFLSPMFAMMLLSIVCIGILRDGITTWMPSYISETYNMSNVIAILSGIILPIFSMLSYEIVLKLYNTKLKNPLACATTMFAAAIISAFLLYIASGISAIFSIILMALLTGCMHGVSLMLTGMLPAYFSKSDNVSTISGILNSCVYIGSAISTYGIAAITERSGWDYSILIWLVTATLGTVLCALCIKPWRKVME